MARWRQRLLSSACSSSSSSAAAPQALLRLASSALSRQSSSRGFAAAPDDTTPFVVDIPVPYAGHRCDPPEQRVETSAKELVDFFKVMYVMRRMEIAADSLYKAKFIRGFCHLYDGQEAVCVGMEAALTKEDAIITAYRDHCTHIGRGGTVLEVMAELMGRKSGCSLGKGGSMHMYNKEGNFYGGNGIVGAQTALGAGLAFAQKYNKQNAVSLALYGDGAANQGQLFEAMNISALWDLPVIFVCENNHYGMGTAEWRSAKSPEYYKRGDYVPGLKIDGMDVLAVKQGVRFAKEHALTKGPIERDPIERVRKLLLAKEIVTVADLKNLEKQAKAEVDEAVNQAKEGGQPETHELFTHVHVKGLKQLAYGPDRKEVIVPLP
ncbi:hypothetical protein SELMODRAFT_404383 [Selaginella moellendorffii]|uniref:pyruvate dehydrogenase (acetyl-transferring) n=1 Tax=Selaginella moellendorffii TaxID=88036 RepID=D8QV57_SELML|nr:hypothetical protein SELMODRAFT_404383 [Selaginella moellendorffii]